jgi:hypothetical protein
MLLHAVQLWHLLTFRSSSVVLCIACLHCVSHMLVLPLVALFRAAAAAAGAAAAAVLQSSPRACDGAWHGCAEGHVLSSALRV